MFTEVLPGKTKAVLASLEKSDIIQNSYLGGGTALALQLGHRISYDLDFFTPLEFDEKLILPQLDSMGLDFTLEKIAWRTVSGKYDNVLFSLFYYNYPLLFEPENLGKINVIESRDIGAMKIAAIAGRGVKRDFIDLYFICRKICSLYDLITMYDKKFDNLAANAVHILKSLEYFEDAEKDQIPEMLLETDWGNVKEFFRNEVKNITRLVLS